MLPPDPLHLQSAQGSHAAMQPLCAALELEAATSSRPARLSARNTADSIA